MKIKLPNPLKWSWKKRIIVLVVLVVLGGGGYWYKSKQASSEQQITTVKVAKGNLVNQLSLSGQVEKSNLISVLTKSSGVVSKVYVTDGQEVKAGQKLAEVTLDSEGKNNQAQAWSSYLGAKKNLESAKASKYSSQASMLGSWDDYKTLAEGDTYKDTSSDNRNLPEFVISQDQWLAAEANYKLQDTSIANTQASVNQAWYNYQLYQATITAPVDGTVKGLNIAEGLTVSYSEGNSGSAASQGVATIKTSGEPVALFNVTEVDISKIVTGQAVTITFDSLPNKKFDGKIVSVDRVGTVTSGVTQYPVLVKIATDDPEVLTNMAATATVVLDSRENVLIVPAAAVISRGDRKMVRVMKDGKPTPVQVETGLETDTEVEITSGLNEGDEIISGSTTIGGSVAGTSANGSRTSIPHAGGGFVGGGGGNEMFRPRD